MKRVKIRVVRDAEGEVVATYQLIPGIPKELQAQLKLEEGDWVEEMEVDEDYHKDPNAFHKKHKKEKPKK